MDDGRDAGLRDAVGDLLGRPVVELVDVRREPLEYDAFLAHRAVTRIRGQAVLAGGERLPWSLVEKRTEGPALAVPYLVANGARELAAYRSGLLDALPPGIRAPRAHGTARDADGGVTLRLEEVRHAAPRPLDPATLLDAAEALGSLAGRWLGRPPEDPWLFAGWIDRHAQPEAAAAGARALAAPGPRATALLGERIPAAARLVAHQDRVRAALGGLPDTLCHHDATGANVFADDDGIVLIDWESVGPGPVGADLASLLFSSVRRGDASVVDVSAVLDDAVVRYAEGIRAAGGPVPLDVVRRGLDAAIALRWKLAADLVVALDAGSAMRRGSLPDEPAEHAQAELTALLDVLLAAAGRVVG
ncbi:phosphotransferase family protein [Clavibacter zhangzhiyongii]|uniref:phosphotransferase family protein n=1 Tax=Clavibacter zhangzhiyongii TaxID=2768071 RepID=UPI0039E19BF1